ncbi:MAG: alpha-1,2-fucosyltransferase [Lachnospiraceae bacterium]|nr:alpha-1,2-fucosyltransferase [Lachnospiraceae bacterium]
MKTIVDIKAGLGNQLFCYAFGYAVSRKTGSDLYIDTSVLDRKHIKDRYLELLKFSVPYKKRISFFYTYNPILKKFKFNRFMKRISIGLDTSVYKEQAKDVFDENVFKIVGNTYFDGYWQSYKYFDSYRDELLDIITLDNKTEIEDYENTIIHSNSVSIHIRRGDYVSVGWGIPMDYYLKAIEELKNILSDQPLFAYVFSDDIDYAKEYFKENPVDNVSFVYMDYLSDKKTIFDMYLMSCCKYNIIANSTYSWWAAYLNRNKDKIVICPEHDKWNINFYLPEWTMITV